MGKLSVGVGKLSMHDITIVKQILLVAGNERAIATIAAVLTFVLADARAFARSFVRSTATTLLLLL